MFKWHNDTRSLTHPVLLKHSTWQLLISEWYWLMKNIPLTTYSHDSCQARHGPLQVAGLQISSPPQLYTMYNTLCCWPYTQPFRWLPFSEGLKSLENDEKGGSLLILPCPNFVFMLNHHNFSGRWDHIAVTLGQNVPGTRGPSLADLHGIYKIKECKLHTGICDNTDEITIS